MAYKPLERKRSTQLELPNIDTSTKTSKPALWRIDSNILRGKLLSELSVPSLDMPDKVNRCLSPLVEDGEDGILSQVKIDGSTSSLKHDPKDNTSSSNFQLLQVQLKENVGNIDLPSNDITLKVQSNEEKHPSHVQLKSNSHDDGSPSQLLKPHSNDDKSPSQLKSCSNDDRSPPQLKLDSHDDRSPSQLKPHSNDDRSLPQLKSPADNELSPSQSLKLLHSHDNRSPSQLIPPGDNNRDHLSFRSYSSIEGQVCPITPVLDDRATTSYGLPDGSDALPSNQNQLRKKFSFKLSQQSIEDELFSPSVLPPLKSPLLPRISNRQITSSPCGHRDGSLRRNNTSRSLNAQKRHHRNSDSVFSLPEFNTGLERQQGRERQNRRLERKMTWQKSATLALAQSMELLATPDVISPGFQSAMSSDGYNMCMKSSTVQLEIFTSVEYT